MADSKIRVLLADDHAMFRQGIKEMLSTDEGIEVVGEAGDGLEAVALAEKLRPNVVLLEVELSSVDSGPFAPETFVPEAARQLGRTEL